MITKIHKVGSLKRRFGEKDPVTGKRTRLWREHIKTPDDIWNEIVQAGTIPGVTSAPKLQPIAARIVMLQSGMRAPMGVKILGQNLEEIERVGYQIEKFLKELETADLIANPKRKPPYRLLDYIPPNWKKL